MPENENAFLKAFSDRLDALKIPPHIKSAAVQYIQRTDPQEILSAMEPWLEASASELARAQSLLESKGFSKSAAPRLLKAAAGLPSTADLNSYATNPLIGAGAGAALGGLGGYLASDEDSPNTGRNALLGALIGGGLGAGGSAVLKHVQGQNKEISDLTGGVASRDAQLKSLQDQLLKAQGANGNPAEVAALQQKISDLTAQVDAAEGSAKNLGALVKQPAGAAGPADVGAQLPGAIGETLNSAQRGARTGAADAAQGLSNWLRP